MIRPATADKLSTPAAVPPPTRDKDGIESAAAGKAKVKATPQKARAKTTTGKTNANANRKSKLMPSPK